MTEVKCRCTVPYCTIYGRYDYRRVHHNEEWFCDSNEGCDIDRYTRPNDAPKLLYNPECIYCSHEYMEFAKYVKNYSYDSEGLTIGRDFYALCEIEYLEIDGRILIGGDEA